jgi:methylated-DNA-protein-cysteine methyltransferase-like protein
MAGFFAEVYRLVALIPRGRVATYGQIAAYLGSPRAARTVGWAMRQAPEQLRLPCHRVVSATGQLAPDHAFGGAQVQRAMLESEGVAFGPEGCVDVDAHLWRIADDPRLRTRRGGNPAGGLGSAS